MRRIEVDDPGGLESRTERSRIWICPRAHTEEALPYFAEMFEIIGGYGCVQGRFELRLFGEIPDLLKIKSAVEQRCEIG